jgi:glyoxylase-like metal-dependent hydrolase (beta-lactamase superfamily II)/rhodanese-related sulfurtransferase
LTPIIETVRTEGLGDSTYILIHEGIALVIDPQRDIDRFEKLLDEADAELRLVMETHLHNDYVSGGRDLAVRHGAELLMPAGAAPVFRHRPAFHHECIDLDHVVVRPVHTPGHTPEHTSYVIAIEGRDFAVFSGGSLLVGSAGRTDLLGPERAESLARLQHGSVHRLAALADEVGLYPTHGAGSFCTTSGAGTASSTIGDERRTSPVLTYPDEDSFVNGQLSGLPAYPSYYRHMAPINLSGLPHPVLEAPLLDRIPDDVTVVDIRPQAEYSAGHLPGSLGMEVRDSFGTWIGWITEHNTPLVLVMNEDQDPDEPLRQLARIGYDRVVGIVRPTDEFTETYQTVDVPTFASAIEDGRQVLDVRSPEEWEEGTISGSVRSYVPDLARETPPGLDRAEPVWLVCGTGYRATIAAGIVQSRGFQPIVLADGGATDVLATASNANE